MTTAIHSTTDTRQGWVCDRCTTEQLCDDCRDEVRGARYVAAIRADEQLMRDLRTLAAGPAWPDDHTLATIAAGMFARAERVVGLPA